MIIETLILSAFQQNTRLVACEATRKAICIDPGDKSSELLDLIKKKDLKLETIALTHGHLDHVGGTSELFKHFPKAKIILHKDDEDLYYGLRQQPLVMGIQEQQLKAFGFDYEEPPQLTCNWEHGEIFHVGELKFEIRHCPGHTRGHVVLVEHKQKRVFVGDCLFAGSIGRTDLPGGDHEQLLDSINTNLLSLDDDFTVYSGHGPETTIGRERTTNPFLNGTYQIGHGRYI